MRKISKIAERGKGKMMIFFFLRRGFSDICLMTFRS